MQKGMEKEEGENDKKRRWKHENDKREILEVKEERRKKEREREKIMTGGRGVQSESNRKKENEETGVQDGKGG